MSPSLVMSAIFAVAICSAPSASPPAFTSESYPTAKLTNGLIEATVLLPDAAKGYYRGPRFDWSGLVSQVTYRDHTFFQEWKTPHNPEGNDDAIGPVEEFGMGVFGMPTPLGYEEAKPGETFIKIGVGLLEKVEEPCYRFGYNYRIIKPGQWKIRRGKSWVEFAQELKDDSGWGYRYQKRIGLVKNRPVMVIAHKLTNTGSTPIAATHYCHNFFAIDGDPVGPAYRLTFPFPVTARNNVSRWAETQGNAVVFHDAFKENEALFTVLEGSRKETQHNAVAIENTKTGAGVRISGDQPLLQFHLFAVSSAICPEPFIEIKLKPGESLRWKAAYEFYETQKQ
ncbi:MAG: hypothetical protein HY318_04875 [Armatimonadetes bacterium]|nr:hypothetical protein [Armatimonadota bacterium]